MNIRRRKRTWSDTPHPFTGEDKYSIAKVSLRVARQGSQGRFEAFTNSRPLLERLDAIGKKGLEILAVNIGGEPIAPRQATALSLYLSSAKGLKSFRREHHIGSTRGHLDSLLSRVGINYHATKLSPQPTGQIPAGRGIPCGA